MSINPGDRVGVYEIGSQIGRGGMGIVYRATDTALKRAVAVKVLPDAVAGDTERLARFEREAQALAALNHPNIAQIYGLERASARAGQATLTALVMELVDGPTVAERLASGPLPIDEALPIATQICQALEAAHEAGIVHRDLKPANVKVRPDGTVKVLDFGLARAMDPAFALGGSGAASSRSQLPTVTTPALTHLGMVLGTAAYMSPEQARGKPVDARTDVWALGCVLFEMLTGRRAFPGEDVTDTLAAVVKSEPSWELLPAGTPSLVVLALRRCLHKQPSQRLRDAGAVRVLLEASSDPSALPANEPLPGNQPGAAASQTRSIWRWVAATAAVTAVAVAATWALMRPTSDAPVTHVSVGVQPANQLVRAGRPSRTAFALSPDGRVLVFSGWRGSTQQLFRRALGEPSATPIEGTAGGIAPFLSPDGRWVGFWADSKLKRVPTAGGPVAEICCDAPLPPISSGSWGDRDTILFSTGPAGLVMAVPAAGGGPTSLTSRDAGKNEGPHLLPSWLPGEQAFLFSQQTGNDMNSSNVVVQSVSSGERRVLIEGGADARYIDTGHLVYLKVGTLTAIPFNPQTLQLAGEPVALVDNVMQAVAMSGGQNEIGAGQFSMSANGTLAYVIGGAYPEQSRKLVWVDRKGVETPVAEPSGSLWHSRVSPDGLKIAYNRTRGRSRTLDIWVYDSGRQTSTRLTTTGDSNYPPAWSPDGSRILFQAVGAGGGLSVIPAEGGAISKVLANEAGRPVWWSSRGDVVTLQEGNGITIASLDGSSRTRLEPEGPQYAFSDPFMSPDGRWLAYRSTESGGPEIYVQPYPGTGAKVRISGDGGRSPAWARDGRELFYLRSNQADVSVMAVEITAGTTLRAGQPRALFSGQFAVLTDPRTFDVSPDGQRFLLMKDVDQPEPPLTSINLVLNWADELERRVPVR